MGIGACPSLSAGNLCQSGGDLISAKTGIVTYPLEKWTERASRTMTRTEQVEANGWNNEQIRSITRH
jgi:hypothetical protein